MSIFHEYKAFIEKFFLEDNHHLKEKKSKLMSFLLVVEPHFSVCQEFPGIGIFSSTIRDLRAIALVHLASSSQKNVSGKTTAVNKFLNRS